MPENIQLSYINQLYQVHNFTPNVASTLSCRSQPGQGIAVGVCGRWDIPDISYLYN